MSWNPWLAGLVVGTASIDFLIARTMDASRSDRVRKGLLWLSVGTNLTVLGYLKYANFFLDSFVALLDRCGVHVAAPILHVIVPIGISFYTFEAISYTVDIYRRKIRAERSLMNFLVFILFFPHLVAGPIVRPAIFCRRSAAGSAGVGCERKSGCNSACSACSKRWPSPTTWPSSPIRSSPTQARFERRPLVRDSGLHDSGLLRFFRLQRSGTWHGTSARLSARLEFQLSILGRERGRVLAVLAQSLGNWLRDYLFLPLGGSRASELRSLPTICS